MAIVGTVLVKLKALLHRRRSAGSFARLGALAARMAASVCARLAPKKVSNRPVETTTTYSGVYLSFFFVIF